MNLYFIIGFVNGNLQCEERRKFLISREIETATLILIYYIDSFDVVHVFNLFKIREKGKFSQRIRAPARIGSKFKLEQRWAKTKEKERERERASGDFVRPIGRRLDIASSF